MQRLTTEQTAMGEDLREMLRKNSVRVFFIKKSGDLRDMNCTLDTLFIPEAKQPKNTVRDMAIDKPGIFRVFDLDKQDWRSFDIVDVLAYQEDAPEAPVEMGYIPIEEEPFVPFNIMMSFEVKQEAEDVKKWASDSLQLLDHIDSIGHEASPYSQNIRNFLTIVSNLLSMA